MQFKVLARTFLRIWREEICCVVYTRGFLYIFALPDFSQVSFPLGEKREASSPIPFLMSMPDHLLLDFLTAKIAMSCKSFALRECRWRGPE
jgi:hypothetical protein